MKHNWYHFTADVPPEVEAEGPEAVDAFVADAYETQAQAEHGHSYEDLKNLIDEAQRDALSRIPKEDPRNPRTAQETEELRRAALDAAAETVWSEFPRHPAISGGDA